jgi:hypothetical protein
MDFKLKMLKLHDPNNKCINKEAEILTYGSSEWEKLQQKYE